MCGIFGVYYFHPGKTADEALVKRATHTLGKRGPDASGIFIKEQCALGHTRLSVIDLSPDAAQPMHDESGRYTIVFNGECYNYRELKKELQGQGVAFFSQSDTEVILKMYIRYGSDCLSRLNGCFAFAVFDHTLKTVFAVRDRLGIKPLLYYYDSEVFVFASEMRALIEWGIPRKIDHTALALYFRLNYIPAPVTVLENTYKVMPGQFLQVTSSGVEKKTYWVMPAPEETETDYQASCSRLKTLLTASVERRLIADVPLGCFLSGGIDSAIITGLAARMKPSLNTFTVTFPGMQMYDESDLAAVTARKHGTRHTKVEIPDSEVQDVIRHVLDISDEPFADSSAIAMNLLSKATRRHVTVALSGDGADELFGGYNKHAAHLRALASPFSDRMLKVMSPVLSLLPESRTSATANRIRKAKKYLKGKKLNDADRYWLWCSIAGEEESERLLVHPHDAVQFEFLKKMYTSAIEGAGMNEILYADMRLVLPSDMLTKTDKYSMCEGLEVRVPFLDHTVVEWVTSLSSKFKINSRSRKVMLKESFRDLIPDEIFTSPKHGFEVPVGKWLRNELKGMLLAYTNPDFISRQGIFDVKEIELLTKQLHSSGPGDSPARLWAILVFQHWWKKYMD
jgi:asparagine synthase (glutamine-hydrolysing)